MLDSKLQATAAVMALALLAPGQRAVAQSASEMESRLEAGSLTSSRLGTIPVNAFAVSPSLRYSNEYFAISGRTSALLENRWQLGNSQLSVETYTPAFYGIRGEILANANRTRFDNALLNDQFAAEGRLHLMRQRGGVWLGSGISRPVHTAVSYVNVSSGGIWTKLGAMTLRGTVTSFFFTKVSNDSATTGCASQISSSTPPSVDIAQSVASTGASLCQVQSRLTDFEASVQYQHKLIELTVRGGQRMGQSFDVSPESRQWASAQAAVWVSSQLAAVASGGREPAQPTRGLPARTFASLGLMLAYWPIPRGAVLVESPFNLINEFELRPAGTQLQRVTARIGGVETVEIMGDFSDWAPIPLIRRGRDQWELLVPMPPGIHQINLRIDGGQWIVPPGVPAIRDGFNGEVGVLVVKP